MKTENKQTEPDFGKARVPPTHTVSCLPYGLPSEAAELSLQASLPPAQCLCLVATSTQATHESVSAARNSPLTFDSWFHFLLSMSTVIPEDLSFL